MTTNPVNGAEYARSVSGPTGDIVATTTTSPAVDLVNSTQEATEFGTPRDSTQLGTVRYGWLGAKTRSADNPSGLTRMGVRLYTPTPAGS